MTIRLVLVDDHPIVLEGLSRLIEREPDMVVVAQCGDGQAAMAAVRAHCPDLLILDLQMPRLGGMEVLRSVVQEGLQVPVVLLSADVAEAELLEAIRLGVRGIVLKQRASDVLIRCIRTVSEGGQWLEPDIAGRALKQLLTREATRQRVSSTLTSRERELVELVGRGLRNKTIGAELGITEGTVKIHLHRIYEKLGVGNRVELLNHLRSQES